MPRVDTGSGSEAFDDFVEEQREYAELLQALRSGDFDPSSNIFLSIPDTDPRQAEIRSAAQEGLFAGLQDGKIDKAEAIQNQFSFDQEELQEIAARAVQVLVAHENFRKAEEVVAFAGLPEDLMQTPEVLGRKLKKMLRSGSGTFPQVGYLLGAITQKETDTLDPEIQSYGRAWLEKHLSSLTEKDTKEIDSIVELLQIEPEELKEMANRALGQARENARIRGPRERDVSLLLKKIFSIEPSPEEQATVQQVIELLQTGKEKTALRIAQEKLPEDLCVTPEIWQAAAKGIMVSMDHGDLETIEAIIKQFRIPLKETRAAMGEAWKRLLITDLDTASRVAKKLGKEEELIATVKERMRLALDRDDTEIAENYAKRFKIPLDSL